MRPLLLITLVAAATPAPAAEPPTLVVHAGTLLDGVSPKPREKVSVVVKAGRIVAVEPGFKAVPGATVVDLSKHTVMPGFIDCHVHLSMKAPGNGNALEDWLTRSDLDRAFEAARFARALLQQGFTGARDVGGGDETVALKEAVAAQKVPGPRLWVALEPLSPTAGHGDARNGLDPALSNPTWTNGLVDSVDQARLRVREHKRRRADVIKLMLSGGLSSPGSDPNQQLMTVDELRTAIDTAHALGLTVAGHAYPSGAIDAAVAAGIDSIEHGAFASEATLGRMKARGTFLVPTLAVYELALKVAKEHPELLAPGTVEKELENDGKAKANFPAVLKAGVKVALGTDLGEGDHTQEFALMIGAGMSPLDALFTATRNAAQLLRATDEVGSVQVGRSADLVATLGNPLSDPSQFSKVRFVMRAGVVYRADGQPTTAGY